MAKKRQGITHQPAPDQNSKDGQVIPIRRAMTKMFSAYVGVGICKDDKAYWFAKGDQGLCRELAGHTTSDMANAIGLIRNHLSSETLNSLVEALEKAGCLANFATQGMQKQIEQQRQQGTVKLSPESAGAENQDEKKKEEEKDSSAVEDESKDGQGAVVPDFSFE